MSKHTLSVLVENKPGVLARIAGLFSRRGFNIDSLAVGPTEHPEVSRMTIVVNVEESPLEQVTKQLNKLIEVIKVVELDGAGLGQPRAAAGQGQGRHRHPRPGPRHRPAVQGPRRRRRPRRRHRRDHRQLRQAGRLLEGRRAVRHPRARPVRHGRHRPRLPVHQRAHPAPRPHPRSARGDGVIVVSRPGCCATSSTDDRWLRSSRSERLETTTDQAHKQQKESPRG